MAESTTTAPAETLSVIPGIDQPLPDLNNAEFLNQIISQLWPSVNSAIKKAVETQLVPLLHRKLKFFSKFLEVEGVDMGTAAPKITGIKTYPKSDSRNDIVVDISIEYKGDAEIKGSLQPIPIHFGARNIELSGRLRLLLGPLLPALPLFGGVTLFFLQRPTIKIDFTDLANVADWPLIKGAIRDKIDDAVAKELVYPNRKVFVLGSAVPKSSLQHPDPRGMLRVTVVGVREVDQADTFSKSDVYIVLKVGGMKFKTRTVSDVVSTEFNETFEALLDEYEDCFLTAEVWDKDTVSSDDAIGSTLINLSQVKGKTDLNLKLKNSTRGVIQLRQEWRPMSLRPAKEVLSSASTKDSQLLYVDLGELKGFDVSGKMSYQCDVSVEGVAEEQSSEVAQVEGEAPNQILTLHEHLQFLTALTPEQKVTVKVVDSSSNSDDVEVGQFSATMKEIFDADGSAVEKDFPLEGKDAKGKSVHARLVLRAFSK